MARSITGKDQNVKHFVLGLIIEKWRSAIDLIFLFKVDSEVSLKRETQDKLIADPGRAMNPDFLSRLNAAYDRVRDRHRDKFPNLTVVDTTKSVEPRLTARDVVEKILDHAATEKQSNAK